MSSAFADNYTSVKDLQKDLKKAGLESSNLIVAVDFTGSNDSSGEVCRSGKSLHAPSVGSNENPYASAISILGKTLSAFDEDNHIPAYGFGCSRTNDKSVFSFQDNDKPCHTFNEVLQCYHKLVPKTTLSGPTSFVATIHQAMNIVKKSKGAYHILLIIADGQMSDEAENIRAIEEASSYPLSIVMVGVGDGPWDTMEKFDDKITGSKFDNFQFVPFNATMAAAVSKAATQEGREAHFALHALMEIPPQYRAIKKLGLMGSGCVATPASVSVIDPKH